MSSSGSCRMYIPVLFLMNYVIILTIIIITAIDWLHALDFIFVEVIVFGDQAFFAHNIYTYIVYCVVACRSC